MIQITSNIKNTKDFLRRARVNILRSQTAMARRVGEFTRAEVIHQAPEWRGTLKNRVVMKLFPKTHRSEIMMSSPFYTMVALQNELNIRGQRKLYKSSYPKLAEWASDKGIFTGKPYVIVGGINTRLGRQNRFFLPAFLNTERALPDIALEVISQAVMRTRG